MLSEQIFSKEDEEKQFDEFIHRNFTGNGIIKLKETGVYTLIRDAFSYGYLKGAEHSLDLFKDMLVNRG